MKKLLNKKGFTLMEMMIVIAIIVILVAISVPTFSGSMDKANSATDAANFRAAKAAALARDMDGELTSGMVYDLAEGDWVTLGSGKTADPCGKCSNHKDAHITVDDNLDVVWSNGEECATPDDAE